jgi:hypothetical protein
MLNLVRDPTPISTSSPRPVITRWTYDLDPRTIRSSVIYTSELERPVYATPASLSEVLVSFPRSEAAPDGVAALLTVAGHLLTCSPVHYEFAAIAVEKSFQAVETALRHRLRKNIRFQKLIGLYLNEIGGGTEMKEQLRLIRDLRNDAAHPRAPGAWPIITTINMVRVAHEIIASMFSLGERLAPAHAADDGPGL